MSGWLHALLVQDGVVFQSGGSSSSLSTGSVLIHLVGAPFDPSLFGALSIQSADDSFDSIDMVNLSAPANSGIFFSWTDNAGSSVLDFSDGTASALLRFDTGGDFSILTSRKIILNAATVLQLQGVTLGFFATTPGTAKAVVTGSKGANAALASLMTALAGYGLVTDSTT